MQINIAVVQFDIQKFAPDENLQRAEQFIQQAAGQADIIVFPEDFVTGPLHGRREFADTEQRYVRHFQALAARYQIDIVPGSVIEADTTGKLYNTTYYIEKSGEIRGRYRKVNLWLSERSYIAAGDTIPVFSTAYGKVGLIICWDLMFPEIFRSMLKQGVEIVICPSYWCFEDASVGLRHDTQAEVKLVNSLCVARAFENECILVYANAAGSVTVDSVEERLIGRSQVTVPFKGALTCLDHNREAMFIQMVDTAILQDAEQAYEIRSDLQKGLLY